MGVLVTSFALRRLSKILPISVFGLGVGVGVGFGFGVAECFAIARFSTVGDGSVDAVGAGGGFDEFSSAFGGSVGAADPAGLGKATGVVFGLGIDSRVGLGSGTTVCTGGGVL